jgi:diacylglycerol kinase family enzyme
VLLVVSPHAGHATTAPDDLLREAGLDVARVLPIETLDHNLPQGKHWRDSGVRAVVAAGGDGTVGSVATQLAGSGLPMGILPMGTSNDSARSLGISMDLAEAAQVIAHGIPTEIDVGQVLPAMTEPRALSPQSATEPATPATAEMHAALASRGAYFMHALTLGLNVEFARLATDVARRSRWGGLNYAASAVEALTRFEPVSVTLRLSGVKRTNGQVAQGERGTQGTQSDPPDDTLALECKAVQVAIVNLPVFGGPLNFQLPSVGPRDRLLDFVVIEALEPHPLRETVDNLLAALGRLRDTLFPTAAHSHGEADAGLTDEALGLALPGVHRFQAREAIVETPHGVDVTLDGEIRARTPVYVRLAPAAVRVLLSRESRRALGVDDPLPIAPDARHPSRPPAGRG